MLPSLSLLPVCSQAPLTCLLVTFGSSSWLSMWPEGFAGVILGPSCLSWLFRMKGERDSALAAFFFAGIDHPLLQFGVVAISVLRGG